MPWGLSPGGPALFQEHAHFISFHLSNSLLRFLILQTKRGTERLSNLPKVTQLVSEPVFNSRLGPQSLQLTLMPTPGTLVPRGLEGLEDME